MRRFLKRKHQVQTTDNVLYKYLLSRLETLAVSVIDSEVVVSTSGRPRTFTTTVSVLLGPTA